MSSQSAKLRTTHSTVAGRTPANASRSEVEKVKDRGAERVSWGWVAAIGVGTWVLLAYVVPAVAEFLAAILAP